MLAPRSASPPGAVPRSATQSASPPPAHRSTTRPASSMAGPSSWAIPRARRHRIAPGRSPGVGRTKAVRSIPSPFAGIHRDGMQPTAETLSVGGATGLVEVPSPRRSDLLTDFLPFDRTSLEHAIDRFLDRFEDLGAELSRSPGPTILFTEAMAVAVALLASKVALGLLGRSPDDEADWAGADAGANLAGFSGLPDPWGVDET